MNLKMILGCSTLEKEREREDEYGLMSYFLKSVDGPILPSQILSFFGPNSGYSVGLSNFT